MAELNFAICLTVTSVGVERRIFLNFIFRGRQPRVKRATVTKNVGSIPSRRNKNLTIPFSCSGNEAFASLPDHGVELLNTQCSKSSGKNGKRKCINENGVSYH